MPRVWVLKSLRPAGYEEVAFSKNLIAIGWPVVGDLSSVTDQSRVHDAVQHAFPFLGQDGVHDYAEQLLQFRARMVRGDLVVLLRRSSTDVAVGQVTGRYLYRSDLDPGIRHVRSVRWRRIDMPRASVAWLMLEMPTFARIYRVEEKNSFSRLAELADSQLALDDIDALSFASETQDLSPFGNFKRNLDYARNLTKAGELLTELKVGAFEVPDVFRAAWVQAVAALDHWVRQEVRVRIIWLAEHPEEPRPEKFSSFQVPLGAVERILRSTSALTEVIEEQLEARGHLTYQQPDKIQDAFALVGDAKKLWERVAKVLSEHLDGVQSITGTAVRNRLSEIVGRRNQIAHRNDDSENTPAKTSINAAMVRDTIEWIEELAAAIVEVLGELPSDGE
jgi:RiboL-PSP-HEPN